MAADQFQQILSSLLSTDNEVRQQAEDTYNNVPRDLKVTHLLATIHNGQQSEEARQMAAVLLRRLFTSEFLEFYKELPQEAQGQLLQQILLAVQQDVTPNLRRKICEVVAEAARNLIDDDGNNQWPDFCNFFSSALTRPQPTESIEAQDDQSLVKLLIDMTETCPKFLRPQLEVIFEICMKVLALKTLKTVGVTWFSR
ncbi:Importin-5 [Eumeta japonica]|uniref:Importin-5 n=1 Tax=Eumeta variegata TaxID=151549 RepID=A0A4C1SYH3_EUMVA|nr:Importin-5 [Eumeta japonica]